MAYLKILVLTIVTVSARNIDRETQTVAAKLNFGSQEERQFGNVNDRVSGEVSHERHGEDSLESFNRRTYSGHGCHRKDHGSSHGSHRAHGSDGKIDKSEHSHQKSGGTNGYQGRGDEHQINRDRESSGHSFRRDSFDSPSIERDRTTPNRGYVKSFPSDAIAEHSIQKNRFAGRTDLDNMQHTNAGAIHQHDEHTGLNMNSKDQTGFQVKTQEHNMRDLSHQRDVNREKFDAIAAENKKLFENENTRMRNAENDSKIKYNGSMKDHTYELAKSETLGTHNFDSKNMLRSNSSSENDDKGKAIVKTTTDNEIDKKPGNRNNSEADDKWVWGTDNPTTVSPEAVTLDDRAAFDAAKCPKPKIKLNNMCVDVD